MSTTPAGWFPDPYGRYQQRYWDGSAWTAHVTTNGQQTVDPLGATTTVPFATPATAQSGTTNLTAPATQQLAFQPATAGSTAGTTGAGETVFGFLDKLGPEARNRPDPEAAVTLAGLGGLVVAFGILVLVADGVDSVDGARGKLGILSALIVGGGLAIRLLVKTQTALRSAAVGMGAVGIFGLGAAIMATNADSASAPLLIGLMYIAAWILPGYRGRTVMLGLGALLLVSALGQATSSDSSNNAFSDADQVVGSGGIVLLLAGIVLLGAVFVLDRRGYHGVGTSLVVAALIATAAGVGQTVIKLNDTGGSFLIIATGVIICLVGGYGERRASTWIGALVTTIGVISFLGTAMEPDSVTSISTLLILAGLLLIFVPVIVNAIRTSRAAEAAKEQPVA